MNSKILTIINAECSKSNIDVKSIKAICLIESNMNPWVVRLETNYIWTYRPEYYAKKLNITGNTEMTLQKMSWDLMQIMGGTARAPLMFKGHITELLNPALNIQLGLKYFRNLLVKYDWNYLDAVAAYNSGTAKKVNGRYLNQEYLDKYLDIIQKLEASEH